MKLPPVQTQHLRCGLIWLFVLSMIIVDQEEGDLRWATVKARLLLRHAARSETGETAN
jgi:hypothetical protein